MLTTWIEEVRNTITAVEKKDGVKNFIAVERAIKELETVKKRKIHIYLASQKRCEVIIFTLNIVNIGLN